MQEIGAIKGLSADEVIASRKLHGRNIANGQERSRFWEAVKDVVAEPIFILLVVAALVYFGLGEYREGFIMLGSLAFVAGISLYQESRSRNAVDALNKLSAPKAKVIRNGSVIEVEAAELVIGDCMMLEDGNLVPADGELLKWNDLSVNESILTGESLPVVKGLTGDNRIFQGTMLLSGSCIARVSAIGKATMLGKIGQSMGAIVVPQTPLQLQIRSFIRSMVAAGAIAFVIVWAVNYYLSGSILHGLLHGLTLAMSVLPEEIPVAFSTFMALGAYHLFKKNVIAKSPYTVETLGAATVICVDKTGTITQNAMELAAIYVYKDDRVIDYTQLPFDYSEVLEFAMWASETDPFDRMEKVIHEVYERVSPTDRRKRFSMFHEYPLEGNYPIMTHAFRDGDGETIIASKGSVEGILEQCLLEEAGKERILARTKELASRGYRVLAVARYDGVLEQMPESQREFRFDFIGLICFYDPPKLNIRETINQFYQAGIEVKMITGDHAETAAAIAAQVGFKPSPEVLTGSMVMGMDMPELQQRLKPVNILARMFPDAKLKVIEALKRNGEVVAMTGDGVNDGPALKASHIGISMGKGGSEVAKAAASLVLVDDDIGHMPTAVALGRKIYENLKKAIRYIISIHIPIILIVTLPLVLQWQFIDVFSPVHVIFLELIMGPTCSIVFENEPIEANSMNRPPRKLTTSFFSIRELSMSIVQGLMITLSCLLIGQYALRNGASPELTRTMIYATLVLANIFLTLVNRSFYYSFITTLRYKNPLIPLVILVSLLILLVCIYFGPAQQVFNFTSLSMGEFAKCLLAAVLGVFWIEVIKFWLRRKG